MEKTKECEHEDSGFRCAVIHYGAGGEILPQCKKCSKCGEWYGRKAVEEKISIKWLEKEMKRLKAEKYWDSCSEERAFKELLSAAKKEAGVVE